MSSVPGRQEEAEASQNGFEVAGASILEIVRLNGHKMVLDLAKR
jgi:hypothetical protein